MMEVQESAQEFRYSVVKSTSQTVIDDEDKIVLHYSDSDEDDRFSKQSKDESFKDALDFLDKGNVDTHINKLTANGSETNKDDKEDDDDVLFVGEFKLPEKSSKKRSATTEIQKPGRKAKVLILNTQTEKTAEVRLVVIEKDPEPSNEQETPIQREVTNQEEPDNQQKPITQETPSIEKAQIASDEKTKAEKICTLDPPPRKPTAFSINFVRKFRKNFEKMNRNDLEELIIQKCVEAIVHKSDDADMRNRIETQENKLQSYHTKYQELSKQYRDLQIVYQRVIKDLEDKNQSVVTPLKITRSVGLQVCLPRREIAVLNPPAPLKTPTPNTTTTLTPKTASTPMPKAATTPTLKTAITPTDARLQQQQRSEISIQQQSSQFQQQQTENNFSQQQLMQNNTPPAFEPQANVRKPATPHSSALSLNQNSSPETPGSDERRRTPPVFLKNTENQRRMISITSSSSNSTTTNVYSNQSKLANTTIVRSSVTAAATTTTINKLIDLTDEEDSIRANVVSNGTNPPDHVAIPTKVTASQDKVTYDIAKENSPQSTIQMAPQNQSMQTIVDNYVAIPLKRNNGTQLIEQQKQQPRREIDLLNPPAPLKTPTPKTTTIPTPKTATTPTPKTAITPTDARLQQQQRPEISIQQQRSQFQQQQTENNLLQQQLMQNNTPAFEPQANVRKPATPHSSALSLNQNSSPEKPGSDERPRTPPVFLKKMENQRRMISITSSSSNSTTTNVYSNQSKLANTTIVRSSVTAAGTTTTINKLIDLTDEEDSIRANVVSNGTNPPDHVAIPTKVTASQDKVTYDIAKENSPQSTIQLAPQNQSMLKIVDNYVPVPLKSNNGTQIIVQVPKQQQQQQQQHQQMQQRQQPATTLFAIQRCQHPPPLPLPHLNNQPSNSFWKYAPPRPIIRVNNIESGIVISWTMDEMTDKHAEVVTYQIYAYRETSAAPSPEAWQNVGDVKAMSLPMAVTLAQSQKGERFHFAVRAVDEHSRYGLFSLPKTWI